MGLSSIASEQRAKEAEALRSVLIFSLIGSLAVHLGLLTLGNINFLNKAPEIEEKPLEVVIVDPPTPEVEQPQQKFAQAKTSLSGGSSLGGGSTNPSFSNPRTSGSASKLQLARTTPRKSITSARTSPKATPKVAPSPAPIPAKRQPVPDTIESKQKLIEDLKKAPVR